MSYRVGGETIDLNRLKCFAAGVRWECGIGRWIVGVYGSPDGRVFIETFSINDVDGGPGLHVASESEIEDLSGRIPDLVEERA